MKKLLLFLFPVLLIGQGITTQTTPAGTVGPRPLSDGGITTERFGRDGAQVTQEGHGRYQENILRGNTYQACNQVGAAMPVALSATATGFVLSNPAGSGYNLVLLDITIVPTTAIPAGISSMVLAANVNTAAAAVVHTTPLTVRNSLLGQTRTGVALVDSAATLPVAPVIVRAISGGPAATGSTTVPYIKDEVAGILALQPGSSVSMFSITTAMTAITCMTWEEVQI